MADSQAPASSGVSGPAKLELGAPGSQRGRWEPAEGWIPGVPPLAVEYASVGQDEKELQDKIYELLADRKPGGIDSAVGKALRYSAKGRDRTYRASPVGETWTMNVLDAASLDDVFQ